MTWLPGRVLIRNQAITVMVLAETKVAGSVGDHTDKRWLLTAFATFLRRIVDADVHSLTVHLAGTFTPTEEMSVDAKRSGVLTGRLVARARRSGRLRPDVVAEDLTFLLEGAAAIRLPDAARTAELRRRYVELFLDALASPEQSGLPGPAPTPGELNWVFGAVCDFRAWPAVPIRVAVGADDRFFPAAFQQQVARDRLGIEADVLPGGHLVALAQPAPLTHYLLAR